MLCLNKEIIMLPLLLTLNVCVECILVDFIVLLCSISRCLTCYCCLFYMLAKLVDYELSNYGYLRAFLPPKRENHNNVYFGLGIIFTYYFLHSKRFSV